MNPYENLDNRAFWKLAVAHVDAMQISDLWQPKFRINKADCFVTYGSCFAQHIGRALKARGFNWTNMEEAPHGLSTDSQKRFNYGVFSSRTGNIYTSTLLRQWTSWATGTESIPEEVWISGDRFYDPFRPAVEPNGFLSIDELRASQLKTVESFRASILNADFFVFTMGLTESWFNSATGYEYPMCPGTIAGSFDPNYHCFVNQSFEQVHSALVKASELMKSINPDIKIIITVSPVPLTATMSGMHVLTATTHSKSILRTVAGQLHHTHSFIDYFPSYEIITAPIFGGRFYESNKRGVTTEGVNFVMNSFFRSFSHSETNKSEQVIVEQPVSSQDDETALVDALHCEEEFLEAFAGDREQ